MSKFRDFKPGDKVQILKDRIESWQPSGTLTVAKVHMNHGGGIRSAGHPQSLTMTNGQTFSAWWFDPATICPWARDAPLSSPDRTTNTAQE